MSVNTYTLNRTQFDAFRWLGTRIRRKRGFDFGARGDAVNVKFEGNTYPARVESTWPDGEWMYARILPRKASQCAKCGAQWPEREGLECRVCTKDAPVAAPQEKPPFRYEMTGTDLIDALHKFAKHLNENCGLGGIGMKSCGFTLNIQWNELNADGVAVKKKKGCPGCMYCRKKGGLE